MKTDPRPGRLFKKLREAKGLSITEVAHSSTLCRSTIYNFEDGFCAPRCSDLISLCQTISIDPLAFIREAYLPKGLQASDSEEETAERAFK